MIENQCYLFLVYTINGIFIGILFDIFRVLYSIFTFSNGEIRLYMFLGVFLGCLTYMMLISKYFIKINVKIVVFFKKIFGIIFSILLLPIKFLFKPIRFITINIKKISIKQLKHTKN